MLISFEASCAKMSSTQDTVAAYLRTFALNTIVDHKAISDMTKTFNKSAQHIVFPKACYLIKMRSNPFNNIAQLSFQKQIHKVVLCIALYEDNVWRHHINAAVHKQFIETTTIKKAYIVYNQLSVPTFPIRGPPVSTPMTCVFYLRKHHTSDYILYGASGPNLEETQNDLKSKLDKTFAEQISKLSQVDRLYDKFLSLIYCKDTLQVDECIIVYVHVPTVGDMKEKLKAEVETTVQKFMFYDYCFAEETFKNEFMQTEPPESYTFVRNRSKEWKMEGLPELPHYFIRAGTMFIDEIAPKHIGDRIVIKHSDVVAKLSQTK